MKKIIISVLLLLIAIPSYSQNQSLMVKEIEMFMLTEGLSSDYGQQIYYKIESQSLWVWENLNTRLTWRQTSNQKWLTSTQPLNAPSLLISSNTDLSREQDWIGFDFVSGSEEPNPDQPDFAYGIYKLQAFQVYNGITEELPGAVYLDYRDGYYPFEGSFRGHYADIYIKYNATHGQFYSTINISDAKNNSNWSTMNELSITRSDKYMDSLMFLTFHSFQIIGKIV